MRLSQHSSLTKTDTYGYIIEMSAIELLPRQPLELVHDEEGPGRGSFKAWFGDCLATPQVIEQSTVSLIVTSPPYPGVPQPEDDYVTFIDPMAFKECHAFLKEVWRMCFYVLADEGRLVVNIYDIPTGAEGMYPNVAAVIKNCLSIGFVLRERYIWHKGVSYRPPKGSWPYPKGVLSGNTYEDMIVFQKPLKFSQRKQNPEDYPEDVRNDSKLPKEASSWLADPIWKIPADREARRLGHPFPFPRELPLRFIKLYTMQGDIVFDPFGGAGTTGIVARQLGRHGIITELSRPYIDMIDTRTAQQTLL